MGRLAYYGYFVAALSQATLGQGLHHNARSDHVNLETLSIGQRFSEPMWFLERGVNISALASGAREADLRNGISEGCRWGLLVQTVGALNAQPWALRSEYSPALRIISTLYD